MEFPAFQQKRTPPETRPWRRPAPKHPVLKFEVGAGGAGRVPGRLVRDFGDGRLDARLWKDVECDAHIGHVCLRVEVSSVRDY